MNATEIRQAITSICQGINYQINYVGYFDKRNKDNWVHDKFIFIINGETFDYHQGIGHSTPIFDRKAKYGFEKLKGLKFKRDAEKEGYTVFTSNNRFVKKPHLADLLYCLISDANCGIETFDDFCSNYGYDTDSRKALEIYLQCQETNNKLRKVLSGDVLRKCEEILQDY